MPVGRTHLGGRAQPQGYLRFFVVLSAIAASYPFLTGDSCTDVHNPPGMLLSNIVGKTAGLAATVNANVNGAVEPVAPRQPVDKRYLLFYPGPESAGAPPVAATSAAAGVITYWPPTGAFAPYFTGPQPDNPQGPPPYVFSGLPGPQTELVAHYGAPALPPDRARYDVGEMCRIVEANGNATTLLAFTTVTAERGAVAAIPPAPDAAASPESAAPASSTAAAAADYAWWLNELYFYTDGVTMDTDLCNAATGYLQGGSFFVAVRLPISEAAPRVPVVFRYAEPGRFPSLDLLDETSWPPVVRTSLPLEPRHEWLDWAENALPRADGERWVTLAPRSDAEVRCPDGLSLTNWEYHTLVPLDAGADAGAWDERVFPAYLCFVGSTPPPFVRQQPAQTLAGALAGDGDGTLVTPLGPFPIRLTADDPAPPFAVHNAGLHGVYPPQRVQLMFMVENGVDHSVTAAVSVTSKLKLPWRMYAGDFGGPDLGRPITAPITITKYSAMEVWAVVDVPAGVGGGETVTLTATEPGGGKAAWNTGVVWLGSWPHVAHVVRRRLP